MSIKNINDLVNMLILCRNANIQEKGLLCFINSTKIDMGKVAINVAKDLSPEKPLPVFLLQGYSTERLTFSKIKNRTRIRLNPDNTVVTESSGLIFPQNEPVILWIDGFDFVERSDQIRFAHLVDGEWEKDGLCKGSILIAQINGGENTYKIDPGVTNRGLYIDFDPS
jgi:hypothetical protein